MNRQRSGSVVLTILLLLATVVLVVQCVFYTATVTHSLVFDRVAACQQQYCIEGLLTCAVFHGADNFQALMEQSLLTGGAIRLSVDQWPGAVGGEILFIESKDALKVEVTLTMHDGSISKANAVIESKKGVLTIKQWHIQ